MDELSDTKIRNAKPTDNEYVLGDGQGLSVLVRPKTLHLGQKRFEERQHGLIIDNRARPMSLSPADRPATAHELAGIPLPSGDHPTAPLDESCTMVSGSSRWLCAADLVRHHKGAVHCW